jgi:membrane protein implicated in regulation of membrane protease activity
MNEKTVPSSPRSEILRILAPLAAWASMASFAAREADPAGASESAYLALLAAAVLLPAGFLAPWPAYEVGIGSALAAAVVWALPPGPGRGAAMMVLLVAVLAVAAGRALFSPSPSEGGGRGWERGPGGEGSIIPLALGSQVLLRGDLLFAPPPVLRLIVALIVLPVAGGIALSILARRHGMALALSAGGTAVALAPGFNVASTLGLIALAAGTVLTWEDAGPVLKTAAWIALLAPVVWAPVPGAVAAVCGLALGRPRLALGLAVVAVAGVVGYFHASIPGIARQAVWLFLLVPAAILPGRERIVAVIAAVLLAGAVPPIPGAGTLAAPMTLAALSLRRDAAFFIPQGVWTGALVGGTALLASYPWLRGEPMPTYLSLFGLAPGPVLALVVVCVALALAGLGVWMGRGWGEPLRSARLAGLAAACLALGLLVGLPDFGTALLAPEMPVVLDAGHPVWEASISGRRSIGSVVVESSLSNGAGLAPGTPVAIVRLRSTGRNIGRPEANWVLRAGEGTGEWAARRPDVAQAGVKAPGPWVSWVAGDFLGQRYRTRWTLARPGSASSLRIERAPGVPPDLAVAVYQLEIRR